MPGLFLRSVLGWLLKNLPARKDQVHTERRVHLSHTTYSPSWITGSPLWDYWESCRVWRVPQWCWHYWWGVCLEIQHVEKGGSWLGFRDSEGPRSPAPSPKQKSQMVRESQPLPLVRTPLTNLCLEDGLLFAEEPSKGLTRCIPVFFVLNSQISFAATHTPPPPHILPFCPKQFPVVRVWMVAPVSGVGHKGVEAKFGAVIHICCEALDRVQVWATQKRATVCD